MLMTSESMKDMISKQGALLKFQHHFDLLANDGNSATSVSDKILEGCGKLPPPVDVNCIENKEVPSGKLSKETIREESKIYGWRNNQSKLSEWQKAVNNAAFNLCVEDLEKMYDRAQLKYAAEEEARKTYVFKKAAGSRSEFHEGETSTKRMKLDSGARQTEIEVCS